MFFLKKLPTREMLERYGRTFPQMDVDCVGAALDLLRRASELTRRLDAYFSASGLSQVRFLILVVIDREPEGCGLTPTEIADRLDVSKPVLTRSLQSLENAGMIAMDAHPQDRRAKVAQLTAQGRAKLHDVLPGYYTTISAFMRQGDDFAA